MAGVESSATWRRGNAAKRFANGGWRDGGPSRPVRNWFTPTVAALTVLTALTYSMSNLLPILAPIEVYPPERIAKAYCATAFRGITACHPAVTDVKTDTTLYRWEKTPTVVIRKVQDGMDTAFRHHLYLALKEHLAAAGFGNVPITDQPPISRQDTIDIRFPPWAVMGKSVQDKTRSLRWGHKKGRITWVELSLNNEAIQNWAETNTGRGKSYESNLKFYAEAMAGTVLGRVVGDRPARRELTFQDGKVSLETVLTALHYHPALKTGADAEGAAETVEDLAERLSRSSSFMGWLAARRPNDDS